MADARRAPIALLLLLVVLGGAAAAGAAAPPGAAASTHFRAGERIAEAVTVATGVPISPLLGVSGLGAYRWWRTPAALRPALPWYARPGYWGTGLALAILFAVNSTLGVLVPGLKKPMDFVEHYENQASALLASPVVVHEALRLLAAAPEGGPSVAALPAGGLAGAGVAVAAGLPPALAPLAQIGTAALVLIAFGTVFLAFHAVQVLITLSPSTLLDLVLRLFRLGALSLAAMAAAVHPYVGAAFGLLLLLAASLVAGWAFRLAVWGWAFAGDLLGGRRPAAGEAPVAFAARGLGGPPPRTRGRLERDAGGALRFVWRPWLLLPRRALAVAPPVALRRGALSPVLIALGVREPVLVRFPPRYKGAEEALARALGTAEVRDGRMVRGLRAAWGWLRDTVRGDGASELAG